MLVAVVSRCVSPPDYTHWIYFSFQSFRFLFPLFCPPPCCCHSAGFRFTACYSCFILFGDSVIILGMIVTIKWPLPTICMLFFLVQNNSHAINALKCAFRCTMLHYYLYFPWLNNGSIKGSRHKFAKWTVRFDWSTDFFETCLNFVFRSLWAFSGEGNSILWYDSS